MKALPFSLPAFVRPIFITVLAMNTHLFAIGGELSPVVTEINPKEPWNPTGIVLKEGQRYRFTAVSSQDTEGNAYADHNIQCSPDGPVGFKGKVFAFFARNPRCWLNPARWIGPGKVKRLRVLKDRDGTKASFLTVIGTIGMDDSEHNAFVIGSGCEITSHATGPLFVFSNDWPGGIGKEGATRFTGSKSYPNNTGKITLTVEPIQ